MKTITAILTAGLLFIASPAWSLDLQTAKDQGLVGETPSGYLEPVKAASAEVKALIESINAQRKAKYEEIATRNKTSLTAIEQLAGEKAIEKSSPGAYVKVNGAWQKK